LFSSRSGSQTPLLQQPEQDVTPHAHCPKAHASPCAHALHETPPVPHCCEDSLATSTHVFPLQHPAHPEDVLHTHVPLDVLHVSPVPHPPQDAPLVPHDVFDCCAYSSHVPVGPPTQQPLGHVFESHAHCPLDVSQRRLPQEAQAAPPVPHWPGPCRL
jgi:hypothetical protein